jgi:D-galactonate transporter
MKARTCGISQNVLADVDPYPDTDNANGEAPVNHQYVDSSTHAPITDAFRESVYRKVAWRLLPLLFACYVLNYLDRINISYAQLQMRTELGFSDIVYGLGASMFFAGYVLFEIPSNMLLQKIGARKTLLRIMLLWGLVSASTLFVRTPNQFYIARFMLGVFEAGLFPGIILYLTFWFPPERRARVVSLFMTATVVSGMISGPVSGWILHNLNDFHGLMGWQWLYLLEGLPSCGLGIVVYLALSDTPAQARWLTSSDQEVIRADMLASGSAPSTAHGGIAIALRSPAVYMYAFLYFALGWGAYALSFWMPSIIQSLGVADTRTIGLLSMIPYTFGAVAMVWYGRRSDRKGERRWHVAAASFVAAMALAASTWTGSHLWLSIALLSLALGGIIAAYPVFWAAATSAVPPQAAAASIAAITSIGALSGVTTPYAIGVLKTLTGSLSAGLYCAAAMVAIGGLVMLFGYRREPAGLASARQRVVVERG